MGYAYYEIMRNGEKIEAGYSVEAVCEEPGCKEQIDRGLAHLCGAQPGGDEYGCGGYYCGKHLYLGVEAPLVEGLCARCDRAIALAGLADENETQAV
ncbi:hypothetical protein [Streptomyces sp. NPDC088736]|uniref:hypothetical protein n=1 Tax=Streptomyces sp. NPDC088736 TaxID=3365881 RepID=UPI0037F4E9E2